MPLSAIHGYPRIGTRRELKRATERYWDGEVSRDELDEAARSLRLEAWERMRDAGIGLIPSNTFSFYDQVLDTTAMVGAVPARYGWQPAGSGDAHVELDTYFAMARGAQGDGLDVTAMEMTKWFDTNYHYIVPEFDAATSFRFASTKPLDEYIEARDAGIETVPVLVGPLSYLLLGKGFDADGGIDHDFDRLALLPALLDVYAEMLRRLSGAGARWVQFDEPVLVQDRTAAELDALRTAYETLAPHVGDAKLLVTTYFGDVDEAYPVLTALPVDAIGLDLHCGQRNAGLVRDHGLPDGKVLVAGVVDGRNVWINDLAGSLGLLGELRSLVGDDRLIVSTSCSLIHTPIEVERENRLDGELQPWLAFANQKVEEVAVLARALDDRDAVADQLDANAAALESRRSSARTNNAAVRDRVAATTNSDYRRPGTVEQRRVAQRQRLNLPPFPTTTIGSFPQTPELRRARRRRNSGEIDEAGYEREIEQEVEKVIRLQEEVGLDVLVHGEPERNDMVEYFGEQLDGFAFTRFGWVQSFGSRYVKPPIIFGDVSRPGPMTVRWAKYAQTLSERPVKGMVTGPVTILNWSFVRDDQPRGETCIQIALALRDEVVDLEAAEIAIVQVDEPALREGLPLRTADWVSYLEWAVPSFKLATSGVRDETQIQSHMCYVQLNEVIDSVSDLDADVLLIFNARSDAEGLEAFRDSRYDKEIGLGVWDIHSPRVPSTDEMAEHVREASEMIDPAQLWVNPDCGLKTRRYEETVASLEHLVEAARVMRAGS
ncbi:MAG: 5-methyltetrahydropteroyltriglutamate--homocysteine S-methyltransferase [Dehalococcoidia bacterium]|jgi:5-methyltetrahydropteroyltriglutamate--homocysteine methyltransferase|nr:5-methyltetrahydropteroyltriglutamate--homocysteine S-methyltransferase [Dehalococcoidia bacterium]